MSKKITLTQSSNQQPKSGSYSKIYNAIWPCILLLSILFAGCKKDDFGAEVVGLCPVVVTDPADKAVDVVLDKVISATFNTDMNAATINKSTFIIKKGSATISGEVSPTSDAKVYTFTPDVALSPFTTYTGRITTGVKDTLRTSMADDYVWTFTTLPEVTLSSDPVAGGTTSGEGTFNQNSSVTVTALANAGYVFVNWTKNGDIVSSDASYQFSMAGNTALVANFSQVITFTVLLTAIPAEGGSTTGTGTYAAGASTTIRAIPNSGYSFVGWTGGVTSTTNPLPITVNSNLDIKANFIAGGPIIGSGTGPTLPVLGGAVNFSILTKAGISTTGVSLINGDIGVSPAAATAITGFGLIKDASGEFSRSPIVTGRIYASDYAAPTPSNMTTAISNMETAYTTANGLVTPAPVIGAGAGNISGLNLAPGLYKWSTGVLIDPNTTVTLSGGVNDTWVFQIAQDLTVSNSAKIILQGGAQAKNIMWVVAGQATLGTQANFSGIILSKTLISLNNGAVITGKLLAQTAVTLIGSTVIQP